MEPKGHRVFYSGREGKLSSRRLWLGVGLLTALLAVTVYCCVPSGRRGGATPRTAMWIVPPEDWPRIEDDLERSSMIRAIDMSLKYLTKFRKSRRPFVFGPMTVSKKEMIVGLKRLKNMVLKVKNKKRFITLLKRHFVLLQIAGQKGVGDVLVTGYYEPILEGSLEPKGPYKHPLYRRPEDLVTIELFRFGGKYRGILRGRLTKDKRIVPYYDRRQIVEEKALKGKGLEIAWVKSELNVFFLHIQGSGQVRLPDGKRIRVNYHTGNGQTYRPVGRLLIREGRIKRKDISMQKIKEYLIKNPHDRKRVLNYNPSFIFFRVMEDGPLGSLAVPVTPGRTVATDYRLFPRGAAGLIVTWQPDIDATGKILRWLPVTRFVVNQDTGGAIRGPGRVDLFCGNGPYAELWAGYLRHPGRMYFLAPRRKPWYPQAFKRTKGPLRSWFLAMAVSTDQGLFPVPPGPKLPW